MVESMRIWTVKLHACFMTVRFHHRINRPNEIPTTSVLAKSHHCSYHSSMLDLFEGCNFHNVWMRLSCYSLHKKNPLFLPEAMPKTSVLSSSDSHPDTLFWHTIWKNIFDISIYIYILTFYLTFCLAYTTCEIQVPDVGEGVPNKIWEATPTVSLFFWDVDHW